MSEEVKQTKSKKGGPQPGSGRPKGRLNQSTIDAMAVKKEYQDKIRRNANQIFNSQFSLAKGVMMLFKIETDSKGNRRKPELVTDEIVITRFLEENEGMDGTMDGDDYFFLTTKVPDSRTITDMLDRAMGKPDANLDITSGGNPLQVIVESSYGNKPNFRPDNTPTEADELAADSSRESS